MSKIAQDENNATLKAELGRFKRDKDEIKSKIQLEGVGNFCWSMLDTVGNVCDIILPACYAHKARQRLLSMTVFCKHYPNNAVILNPKSQTIQQDPNQPTQYAIDF